MGYSPWSHRVRHSWSNWSQCSTKRTRLVTASLVLQYSLKSPCSSHLECSKWQVLIISLLRVVLILNISSLFQRQDFIFSLTTLKIKTEFLRGFPGGSVVKKPPAMQETQEMWIQFLGWEDPLEKGIATHSSILAWRIPWTKEPCGLQSMEWQSQTSMKQLNTYAQVPYICS